MNRENAKDFLPLVQALAEGKVIQIARTRGGWLDVEEINSDIDVANYRIKPEPVGPEEVWLTYNEGGKLFATSDHCPEWQQPGISHVRYRRVEE